MSAEPEGIFRSPVPAKRTRRRLAALLAPVIVRKLRRDRSHRSAVYASLATRADRNVADVRVWRLDAAGRMYPADSSALDLSLPELAAELVAAHRRAIELTLIECRGGAR